MSNKKFNTAVADQARKLIGELFQKRRLELNLSIYDLAQMTDILPDDIVSFEKGTQNIPLNSLLSLCGMLRIKLYFEHGEINHVPGFSPIELN